MILKLLLFSIVCTSSFCDAGKKDELVENHREFAKFLDQDKLSSYLSSYDANPTATRSQNHGIFKRSPRKIKKTKKVLSTTESTDIEISSRPLKADNENKNFTVLPRQIVHFELDDAKYSEEYEKLRQSRKLRMKRSANTTTTRTEKSITKDIFVQPKEFFKFSLSDAVIKTSPADTGDMQEGEKKSKREASDSSATDSKKIHVTSPMRGYSSSKVSYDNISSKLQKMIDSALVDALKSGKASEGDYLRFFYGDKIIKVPVSMAKYISSKKEKEKESTKKTTIISKDIQGYTKDTAFLKETLVFPKETLVYGKKEESKTESVKLLGTKNAYFSLKNSQIKYEKPKFLPTVPTESYVNFDSSPIVVPENDQTKSIYLYSNEANAYIPKNSITSPGPVLFEDSIITTTPTTLIHDSPKAYDFKSLVYHPKPIKEIPITENVNESFDYVPEPKFPHYSSFQAPTSYIEYAGNHDDDLSHQAKDYEFGYHISDFKTGNNFGHMQKSNKKETKGQYSILLPDGRVQIVKYFADDTGFNAEVTYQNVH